MSKGTYGSETVALAERLSIEHEYKNGTGALTTPELTELKEDGFLAKASRKRKHTFTEKEIIELMTQQPGPEPEKKTEQPEPRPTRDTTPTPKLTSRPKQVFRPLDSGITCTNVTFRD